MIRSCQCFPYVNKMSTLIIRYVKPLTMDILKWLISGANLGFQGRGAHSKKLRRAEGGAKIVGVFRVKNHDFTPKNHIFSNFRGARAGCGPSPPPGSAPASIYTITTYRYNYTLIKHISLLFINTAYSLVYLGVHIKYIVHTCTRTL